MLSPSRLARRGKYTLVRRLNGEWQFSATFDTRPEAVTAFLATPDAALFDADRKRIRLEPRELKPKLEPKTSEPTSEPADAPASAPAPRPPRLSEALTLRVTPETRAQLEARAVDGRRWPGGYAVDVATVIRTAIDKYLSDPT